MIQFDELDDLFKVGMQGDLEVIATRDYVDAKLSTDGYIKSSDVLSTVNTSSTAPINSSALNGYHIGMIIAFAGNEAPSGWFICDGREISRIGYSRLFALIGVTYGGGDGTTTFNIPDLRECVLVGSGVSTRSTIIAHDTYSLGEFKDDQFQGHKHVINVNVSGNPDGWGDYGRNYWSNNWGSSDPATTKIITDGTNGTPRNGETTHGKQLGVNYIIKY